MSRMLAISKNIFKIFHEPTDVYCAIYPLYYTCALIGLAPYSIKQLENGRKIFQFSLWQIFKAILLVVFFLGVVVYNAIYHKAPLQDTDNKEKMRYFQEIFASLLSCCSVIFGCIFALKIIEVFKIIDEVDISFRNLAVWVPYKEIYVKIILHLIVIGLGVICSLLYLLLIPIKMIGNYNSSVLKGFLTFTTLILPYFINLVMELQYFHYLNILRIRYKLLNEYLETLVQENKCYNGWMNDLTTTVISSGYKEEKNNKFDFTKTPKSIAAISDPIFIVDQIAALHIKLTDIAHMINHAFCVQQLLRITIAFVSIVTALFWIAVNFSQTTDDGDENDQLDMFFTFWAFSNACEVMGIVWITSETCEEANMCPRILHKIRNQTSNSKLQDMIEIYSLQMYHNRLSFTVCGLFPLDYTLLYTIVAGVTTYLVILIQFNNADFVQKDDNSTTNLTET